MSFGLNLLYNVHSFVVLMKVVLRFCLIRFILVIVFGTAVAIFLKWPLAQAISFVNVRINTTDGAGQLHAFRVWQVPVVAQRCLVQRPVGQRKYV